MANTKRLYFVPIIARAIDSDDPKKAMAEAFDEISELGKKSAYFQGFRQFLEFVKLTSKPFGENADQKNQLVKNAILRLMCDLATDTFEGDENQKNALITSIRGNPQWNAEFELIKKEAHDFLAPETPIDVEILMGEKIIGSISVFNDAASIDSIFPGHYVVRFSSGRLLWLGDLTREDVIWTYAFPERELALAAETEPIQQEPTRTIALLKGELIMYVFAGLESGKILLKSE